MPNTPAMVGAGATALCSSTNFTEDEKAVAEQIFGAIGIFEWVPERLMDAVTAVSGSGPAYVFLFIEAMADAGVREGLPRATAYRLAAQTVLGSGKMMIDTGEASRAAQGHGVFSRRHHDRGGLRPGKRWPARCRTGRCTGLRR